MTIERVPLGTYVKVVGGFAFKSEDFSDEGIPVIRISDLQNGSLTLNNVARIPRARVGKGENYRVNPGDILVAMSGATTGKIGLAPSEFDGLLLQNQRVGNFKITDNSKIDKRYLRHFVSSPSYQSQIWNTMVGVAQPNVSSKQLESFEFPLPPLAEQRRVAEVLDRAEALRTKRRAALAQLDILTQSLFLDLFGDPVSPDGPTTSLGEAVEMVTVGHVGPTSEFFCENGVPFLRTGNVGNLAIITSDLKYVTPEFHRRLRKSSLKIGDVLVSRVISDEVRCAVVPPEFEDANCANVIVIRPGTRMIGEYLAHLICLPRSQGVFLQRRVGSAQSVVNTRVLQDWRIRVPPIELQCEFARRVGAVEKLKTAQRASLAELDALFASLQHRAFRGEL